MFVMICSVGHVYLKFGPVSVRFGIFSSFQARKLLIKYDCPSFANGNEAQMIYSKTPSYRGVLGKGNSPSNSGFELNIILHNLSRSNSTSCSQVPIITGNERPTLHKIVDLRSFRRISNYHCFV